MIIGICTFRRDNALRGYSAFHMLFALLHSQSAPRTQRPNNDNAAPHSRVNVDKTSAFYTSVLDFGKSVLKNYTHCGQFGSCEEG
jgi:hypothetical protein